MKCDVYACQVGDHEFFPHAHALSTAQGGGGSFKDRKLIGEVSCCHAWMAGRTNCWTDMWLVAVQCSGVVVAVLDVVVGAVVVVIVAVVVV